MALPEENKNQSAVSALGAFVWDLVKILVLALVIIVPFRVFVAEPFVVSGHSMLPNFYDKDYLIIDRISYRFSQPQRGDVIVLRYPKDPSQYFIKRIVGLPGDTVELRQGHVLIIDQNHTQGTILKEPYLPSQTETLGQPAAVTLGSDEYYVLGDNRTASNDSRIWGVLPKDDVVGRVWLRVFPLSRFGIFQKPSYQ